MHSAGMYWESYNLLFADKRGLLCGLAQTELSIMYSFVQLQ